MIKRVVLVSLLICSILECSPIPGFDMPLNQDIIDHLTNNFEIRTLKANKALNNIRKLSGIFSKNNNNENVNEEFVDPNANFHSSSHSSSMVMSNVNGDVNGVRVETVNDMDHQPGGELKRNELFEFQKITPEGVITYGNMDHPIYMTPFGEFKPI